MGFLDRLRGGSSTLSVSVAPGEYAPGATVVVSCANDDPSTQLEAGLRCVTKYIVGERGRDANGHPITREVIHDTTVHDDQQSLAGGQTEARFELPANAPPASPGVVEWFAWVAASGQDPVTAPVTVRLPSTADGAGPGATANGMSLADVPAAARAGDAINGTVTVQQPEHVKAGKVEVRLVRRCIYVAQPIDGYDGSQPLNEVASASGNPCIIHDDWVATAEAFGKHSFEPNAPERASFTLAIPSDAGPDVTTDHAQVQWRIEAALHRMLHDDLTVAAPVRVF